MLALKLKSIFFKGDRYVFSLLLTVSIIWLIVAIVSFTQKNPHLSLANLWLYGGILITGTIFYYCFNRQKMVTETSIMNNENNTFDQLLERIPEGIILINREHNIVYINQKAKDTFWYPHKDLVGKSLEYLVPDACELESIQIELSKCFDYQENIDAFQILAKRGDNFYFPASVAISPLQYSGQFLAVLSITDISLHKLDEERLKMQHFSVEQATDAVFWIDQNGQLLYANEIACYSLGYSAFEMSLMTVENIVPQANKGKWRKLWNITQDYNSCVFETELSNNKGALFPVEVVANYVNLEDQQYICAFVRNISARRLNEEQLSKYAAELERKNGELEQITFITSHNLQEPLRSISSFVQLLDMRYRNKLDKEAEEFITFVVDATKQMQLLLRDLAHYSKLTKGVHSFDIMNSQTALKESLKRLQFQITESNANITYDPLPEIRASRNEIIQLFYNLISNAIKYRSKDVPKIHIGIEKSNVFWTFYVRDNGIGIASEYTDKIFRIFNRLHNNQRGNKAGTGMGLAICQKIIEQHGGNIWVESKPQEGATFYFTLPLHVQAFKSKIA